MSSDKGATRAELVLLFYRSPSMINGDDAETVLFSHNHHVLHHEQRSQRHNSQTVKLLFFFFQSVSIAVDGCQFDPCDIDASQTRPNNKVNELFFVPRFPECV